MTAVLEPPVRQHEATPATAQVQKAAKLFWDIATRARAVDSWAVLLGGADGHADQLFADIEQRIDRTKLASVRIQRAQVAPGVVRGFLGDKRDFLVVSDRSTYRLRRLQLYVGVRDWGGNLDVYWYLMHRRGFLDWLLIVLLFVPGINILVLPLWIMRDRSGIKLDLFDESDVRAYVSHAHHCILAAVDKLLLALGQDTSHINRQSRGFLGIS